MRLEILVEAPITRNQMARIRIDLRLGKIELITKSGDPMSVEARIRAALEDTSYSISPDGSRTTEVDIPSTGITLDEVMEHEAVEDAFPNEDNSFHVYVSVDTPSPVFRSV